MAIAPTSLKKSWKPVASPSNSGSQSMASPGPAMNPSTLAAR